MRGFTDERRIYGWPIEWPGQAGKGHFVIENGIWLHGKGQENDENPVSSALLGSFTLVPASEVGMVGFVPGNNPWSDSHG